MIFSVFCYVPGKEWVMTQIEAQSVAEAESQATEFVDKKKGWTQVRLYLEPAVSCASPSTVQWTQSGR